MKINNIAKRAFTLIEIMVATVIMVVLVGLVIQITSEVLKVWTRSSGKLAANAEARIAMDMITQDLETAVFRNNGQQWLRVDGPEAMAASAPYTSHTVALKLFSPALDRDTSSAGDICGIAYRLEYQESYDQTGVTNPVEVYALYRAIARPDDTFNLLMGSASQGTSSPQDSIDGTPAFWTAASILSPDNYLVSNIVDFKVLVYEDDGSRPPAPANANPTTFKLIAGQDYIYGGTGGTNTPLLYADVILTVVSDAGLEILSLPSLAGTGYDDADDVVREYGEVFTRRVNFMARPL
jgi:prepilin-type N-terminal cleavage/methylation domain-containing protein